MGALQEKDFYEFWEDGLVEEIECTLKVLTNVLEFMINSDKAKGERIASLLNDIETLEKKNTLLENNNRILQLSRDP